VEVDPVSNPKSLITRIAFGSSWSARKKPSST